MGERPLVLSLMRGALLSDRCPKWLSLASILPVESRRFLALNGTTSYREREERGRGGNEKRGEEERERERERERGRGRKGVIHVGEREIGISDINRCTCSKLL